MHLNQYSHALAFDFSSDFTIAPVFHQHVPFLYDARFFTAINSHCDVLRGQEEESDMCTSYLGKHP